MTMTNTKNKFEKIQSINISLITDDRHGYLHSSTSTLIHYKVATIFEGQEINAINALEGNFIDDDFPKQHFE